MVIDRHYIRKGPNIDNEQVMVPSSPQASDTNLLLSLPSSSKDSTVEAVVPQHSTEISESIILFYNNDDDLGADASGNA